ncbi:MAG: methyltransferase domain-containing protein [Burkholderiales bacterium]
MAEPPVVDTARVRRGFERAAQTYVAASPLEAEIGQRMLARLDYIRAKPRRILDAGAGPAREAAALLARYPHAVLVSLDISLAMLRTARRSQGLREWLRRGARPLPVVADFAHMPLPAGGVDLLWSNMALHWAPVPSAALREFARVLAPDGLLMFSTLGPDTLKELRLAAGPAQVHGFTDMHDIGDALVGAGFTAPVMDAEHITLTYADPRASSPTCGAAGRHRHVRIVHAVCAAGAFWSVCARGSSSRPRAAESRRRSKWSTVTLGAHRAWHVTMGVQSSAPTRCAIESAETPIEWTKSVSCALDWSPVS